MKLYHGTTKENSTKIEEAGVLNSPVYLTPNKETAGDYAANNSENYVVYEIEIDFEELKYDAEFVNEADVVNSLDAGSVWVDRNVSIVNCEKTEYCDYEEA